jgi:DNA-directed RNA polymerase specialized sigma24 family protein
LLLTGLFLPQHGKIFSPISIITRKQNLKPSRSMTKTDLDALQKHNWEEAFIKLKAFAASLQKHLYKGLPFPQGKTLDDFAQEAIASILDSESTRNWNSQTMPDINWHLMGVIKSKMYSLFKLSETKTTSNFSQSQVEITPSLYGAVDSPLDLDARMDLESLIRQVQMDLEEDEVAFFVFMERLDGLPNREIAQSLGYEVRIVENAQKRIDRVIEKYKKKLLL